MSSFEGFPEGKLHLTPIPEPFFSQLLPRISDLAELKLAIYIFWRLDQMEGAFRYLRRNDFVQDENFMVGMGEDAEKALDEALTEAVRDGILLQVRIPLENRYESLYFLNSAKGRAAVQAIEDGTWRPMESEAIPDNLPQATPNIFRLYEENIGPLTPMIAEALGDAENTYPHQWIEEAIRIAVEKNKRNWRYAEAILKRWQREGYNARKEKPEDRCDSEEARRKYVEGEFSEFIEH
jgi:DnaD/phage-associated family protein